MRVSSLSIYRYISIFILNIEKVSTEAKKRPVMVWIHGGSYTSGSGNGESDIYGPNNLIDRDIVLVTINYRLSVLGKPETDK